MGQRDRIPPARFSSPWSRGEGWKFHGCRHGLALLTSRMRREAVVWDPLTDHQRRVAFPPGFSREQGDFVQNGAVMCTAAAAQDGHVHGDCRFTPFRLALVGTDSNGTHRFACLYDSESGVWGDIVSVETAQSICTTRASILVRDAFCWVLSSGGILQFDFQSQSLAVIQKPAEAHPTHYYSSLFVVRTEHGGLGLAVSKSEYASNNIQLWEMESNCDGVVRWELQKTIDLNGIFSQQPSMERHSAFRIQGYDEDTNALFLSTFFADNMLQLESTQFATLFETQGSGISSSGYYPYRNFYIAGSSVGGQDGGAEM